MTTSSIENLGALLSEYSTFVLTSHVNPDGDALGSELAMGLLLRAMGKSVTILNHSETPEYYLWLDPLKEICIYDPALHRTIVKRAEAIVLLDTNQPDRLQSMHRDILASKARKFVIDHHLDPAPFADYYLIDADATSTGEIIYKLVLAHRPDALTKEMARALYAAIMTDTGSFRFPRTIGETYRIAGSLVDHGADPVEIYSRIYETWSPGRMRLLGEMLDSIQTRYAGKLAWAACTRKSFDETGATEADTDNFTTYPMSIKGVVMGILFCELEKSVKISFRSKGAIPVNKLAKEFGGNGHFNASGARVYNASLDSVVNDVLDRAAKYLADFSP